LRYKQKLICICDGKDETTDFSAILCPNCTCPELDVKTLEDAGRTSPKASWFQRVVSAFNCPVCNFYWDPRQGCPNGMCDVTCSKHNRFVAYEPKLSEYTILTLLPLPNNRDEIKTILFDRGDLTPAQITRFLDNAEKEDKLCPDCGKQTVYSCEQKKFMGTERFVNSENLFLGNNKLYVCVNCTGSGARFF